MEGSLPLRNGREVLETKSLISSRRSLVQCISLNTLILFAHMYAANNLRNRARLDNSTHQGRRVMLFVVFSFGITGACFVLYEAVMAANWTLWSGACYHRRSTM